jgi:hypothetical protein
MSLPVSSFHCQRSGDAQDFESATLCAMATAWRLPS